MSDSVEHPKTFDVMEYKRRVQAEMYEATKDMTPEEEIAYYRMRAETGPMGEWWKKAKEETERRKQHTS